MAAKPEAIGPRNGHELAPLNTRADGIERPHGVTIVLQGSRGSLQRVEPGEDRAAWSGKMQFFLSIIGYSVGLGNIWRFPYLCQQNGGGAFLIPFLIMLILEGIPLFLIEMAIGQKMRLGSLGVWNTIHPWLGGIGISSCIVTLFVALYYNVIITWVFFYLFNSIRVFHLRDIRWERPRFLSKSFLAFVTFNVISYSLLAAEVLTTNVADTSAERKSFYQHVFNGCYAVLLFIVVIFFLIYGVEVYFKLRGEFLKETKVCTIISPRPGPSTAGDGDEAQDTLVTKQGIQTDLAAQGSIDPRSVNQSQLHQSRLGLVSQALMLILIAGFLASETLSEFWKTKVPVVSRNWHDLVFRLAEIGVALWFPCVLWNSMAPERLWLLNPRRLLAKQIDDAKLADLLAHHHDAQNVETDSLVGSVGSARDCWICYDGARGEPLIRPCRCTGDVAAVHHDCLRRWLVESASTPDGLKCKVCNTPYIVQETNRVEWEAGFTCSHWVRTALAVAVLVGSAAAAWVALQLTASPVVRVLAAGAALLICYVCVRFLGMNTVSAYQRAKVSSLRILTDPLDHPRDGQVQLSTISKTVTVEIASKAALEQALKGEK